MTVMHDIAMVSNMGQDGQCPVCKCEIFNYVYKLTFSDSGKYVHDVHCVAKEMSVFNDTLHNVRMSHTVTTALRFDLGILLLENKSI